MASSGSPQELIGQVIKVFSGQPEVKEIYSFGSVAHGGFDQFSDVDITVITSNMHRTTSRVGEILTILSPVKTIFTITEQDDNAAYTIFLEGHSPYQKIDLGLHPSSTSQPLFEKSKLEYKRPKACHSVVSKVALRGESFHDH